MTQTVNFLEVKKEIDSLSKRYYTMLTFLKLAPLSRAVFRTLLLEAKSLRSLIRKKKEDLLDLYLKCR